MKYVGEPPRAGIDLDPHVHAQRLRDIRAEYFPKDSWMADAADWIEWAGRHMADLEASSSDELPSGEVRKHPAT